MAGGLKEVLTYRDAKGNTARVSYYVASSGTQATQATAAAAVSTSITALSNAVLQAAIGPATSVRQEVVYGTNSEFPTVEDKAVFTFQTADGAIHRFQIPAPQSAIFLSDGETVDPANTAVVTFTSAVIANCVDVHGTVIGFGAFGTRIRRKMHRKLNIFIKNPALSGPGE
jgi:hypothetical protein